MTSTFEAMLETARQEAQRALVLDVLHSFGLVMDESGSVDLVPSDPGLFARPDDPRVRDALIADLRSRDGSAAAAVVTIEKRRVIVNIQSRGSSVSAVDFAYERVKKGLFKRDYVLGDPQPTTPTATIW